MSQHVSRENRTAKDIEQVSNHVDGENKGMDTAVQLPFYIRQTSDTVRILQLQSLTGNETVIQPRRNGQLQRKETVAEPPKLKERCQCKDFTIPENFLAFAVQVQDWISTCVLSRTKKPSGEAYEREVELVMYNPSVVDVWNRVYHLTGENIKVFAKYKWKQTSKGGWIVDSIHFHVSAYENIELLRPQPPRNIDLDKNEGDFITGRDSEDITKDSAQIARQALMRNVPNALGQNWSMRMLYVLRNLALNPDIDDAYIALDDLKMALAYYVDNDTPLNRDDLERLGMLRHLKTAIGSMADSSEKSIVNQIKAIDDQIFKANVLVGGFADNLDHSASNGHRFLQTWIRSQQKNPMSIYYYYTQTR